MKPSAASCLRKSLKSLDIVSERAAESRNTSEVGKKVASMVERNRSVASSANAKGNVGVWQVGAASRFNLDGASQNSREVTTETMKEVTQKASDRISLSYKLTTRSVDDYTDAT